MDEQYIGPIRRGMHGAGIPVEFSKGEAWYGQHEVNTRYADAVTAADRHTIYKNGVKEIAFLNDISATFMAKPSEKDIGSSCHIHPSLVDRDGKSAFVDGKDEETDTFRHFLGGMRAHIRELALFVAPCGQLVQALRGRELGADLGLLGPRQPHLRLPRRRPRDSRAASSAASPAPTRTRTSAIAALLAAGLDGIENETDPGPELKGNAYEAGEAEAFPSSLREAVRSVGEERLREEGVRRRGPQALPELRALEQRLLRRGRHRLRAHPDVRARLAAGMSDVVTEGLESSFSGRLIRPGEGDYEPAR